MVVVVVVTTVVCVAGAYENCPNTSSGWIFSSGVKDICSFCFSVFADIGAALFSVVLVDGAERDSLAAARERSIGSEIS